MSKDGCSVGVGHVGCLPIKSSCRGGGKVAEGCMTAKTVAEYECVHNGVGRLLRNSAQNFHGKLNGRKSSATSEMSKCGGVRCSGGALMEYIFNNSEVRSDRANHLVPCWKATPNRRPKSVFNASLRHGSLAGKAGSRMRLEEVIVFRD